MNNTTDNKIPHYFNCSAWLAQDCRMCGECYSFYNNNYSSKAELLIKTGIDLNNVEVLGTHWNLSIRLINPNQHKIWSDEDRWNLFEEYEYEYLECPKCKNEFYFDDIDDFFTNSIYLDHIDSTYCYECGSQELNRVQMNLYENWVNGQIKWEV